MTEPSPEGNRVRVQFRAIAMLTAAVSRFAISVAVANIISGFLGGWLMDVALVVIGLGGLRGAWLVWEMRERIAAGHHQLARAKRLAKPVFWWERPRPLPLDGGCVTSSC